MNDDGSQPQQQGGQGMPTPQSQGFQPQAGQAGGQTQNVAPVNEEDTQLEEFLNSTPPPEPRGAAYKGTSAFQMFTTIVQLPAHPSTMFDEKYFLFLFAGSLSLNIDEKKDILFAKLPTLSQFQIDELIKILEEEKQKFDELEAKHPEQVQKLREQCTREWQMLELEGRQSQEQAQTQDQVDDIKRKLGL